MTALIRLFAHSPFKVLRARRALARDEAQIAACSTALLQAMIVRADRIA